METEVCGPLACRAERSHRAPRFPVLCPLHWLLWEQCRPLRAPADTPPAERLWPQPGLACSGAPSLVSLISTLWGPRQVRR